MHRNLAYHWPDRLSTFEKVLEGGKEFIFPSPMSQAQSLTSRRKRKRTTGPEIDAELPDRELRALLDEFAPLPPSKKTRKRGPRKPTIKTKLVAKLRARKKVLKAELRGVERDLKSLVCRRKPRNGI